MPFLFAVFSPIKHPSNLTTAEGNRSILAAGFGERTAPSSLQQALQQFLFSFFSHSDFVPTDRFELDGGEIRIYQRMLLASKDH